MSEALATILTPLVLALLAILTEKARRDAVSAAMKAERAASEAARATNRVEGTLSASTERTTEKLDEIHVLVNSRLTEALAKIDRLEARLHGLTGEEPTGEPPSMDRPTGS